MFSLSSIAKQEEDSMEKPRYNVNMHNDESIALGVDTPIPPELISSRSQGQNSRVSYIKGDISVDRLNEIFGPLAWGSKAGNPQIDRFEEKRTKWEKPSGGGAAKPRDADMVIYVVTTQITLTIKARTPESTDTVFVQTGVGYGEVEAGKHAKDAIAMAVKGAETDGFKRCTTMLGKAFGMFLNADGSQSDIEYAHRMDRESLTKAKQIRTKRTNARQNDGPVAADSAEHKARPAEGSSSQRTENKSTDSRTQERNNRADERETQNNDGAGREQKREERSQGSSGSRSNSDNSQERGGSDNKPAKGERPKAQVNKHFDLDQEPVTRDDQIAYGATLVRLLEEGENEKARTDLIRKHRQTIIAFDSNLLGRIREQANRYNINIDTIKD